MLINSILTSLFFLTSSLSIAPAVEIITELQLNTVEGRLAFLLEKLAPYAESVQTLNVEIDDLSKRLAQLSSPDESSEIIALTEEVTQKMEYLIERMTVLKSAATVDQDFQALDAIFADPENLSPLQIETLNRIATLCRKIK